MKRFRPEERRKKGEKRGGEREKLFPYSFPFLAYDVTSRGRKKERGV
jgi:hypothetical protein